MGKQIEYSNGELTIVWQPELCRHAGNLRKRHCLTYITRKNVRG